MKKLSFLLTIVMCATIGMVSTPSKGYAILTPLTETGMREATAQAGIALTATDRVALDMEIGSLVYGDDDGTNGTAAYLSMNDISCQGSVLLKSPVNIAVTTEKDPNSNTMVTGVDINIDGAVIDVDHFDIGSITVGPEPGQGKSFGSIKIRGYHAEISGNVRLTAH
jgi:hypothetical protein